MRGWHVLLGVGAGLVAAAWIYGAHVRQAGWVYEDPHMLLATTGWGPRLLTRASWAVVRSPVLAHALNLALHGLVAGLAALLAWRLTRAWLAAVVAGLGLLVHPVAVETVAYAAGGRGELLAAVGIVGACVAVTWASPWRWPLVVGALGVAWLAKESAIVGLALVPLTWAVTTWRGSHEGLTRAWRGGVAGVLLALPVLVPPPADLRRLVNADLYAEEITAVDWAVTQSTAAARLAVVAATGRGMTLDYDYDRIPWDQRVVCAVGVGVVGLVIGAAWRWRPLVAYGLSWAPISLAPRLMVQTPRSYLNEHQVYLALVGVLQALGAAVALWRVA